MGSIQNEEKHDALVVGLGFGGLYSLYLLKQLGLDVKAVESGADVGGQATQHFLLKLREIDTNRLHRHMVLEQVGIFHENQLPSLTF